MKNYLIYTTVTRWSEPPRARHQVANELKKDGIVYFVEPNKTGYPRVEFNRVEENVIVVTPYFPVVYKVRYRTPVLNEMYHKWLLGIIKRRNISFDMVINFDYTAPAINDYFENVLFYCADDNVGFGNFNPAFINKYHTATEKKAAQKSIACVCTSEYMRQKIGAYNSNTYLVPLGAPVIEYSNISIPEKQAKLPVLGLVGYLDSNMDMDLLYKILEKFQTIFIGPVSEANRKKLAAYPNALLAGVKTGNELYEELSKADVCIAPYDVNKLNKGATPNKMWLYLALGKPAVITNMPNIEKWDLGEKLVYRCTNDVFIEQCLKAYEENTYELALKRKEFAFSNTWEHRVEQLKNIYHSALPSNISGHAMVA